MKFNEFKVVKGFRRNITSRYAKLDVFYFIKQKKRTIFGKIKWVEFRVLECWGADCTWNSPEFETLKEVKKYIEDLKVALK